SDFLRAIVGMINNALNIIRYFFGITHFSNILIISNHYFVIVLSPTKKNTTQHISQVFYIVLTAINYLTSTHAKRITEVANVVTITLFIIENILQSQIIMT